MMTIRNRGRRNRGKRNRGKCRAGTAGRDLLGHVQRGLDLLLRHHLRADETRPLSTGRGTRRVQLVREGGRGGGADALSVGGQELGRVD